MPSASRSTRDFARGLTDRETTRYDSLSRKTGYYLRRGATGGVRRFAQGWRENTIGAGRS